MKSAAAIFFCLVTWVTVLNSVSLAQTTPDALVKVEVSVVRATEASDDDDDYPLAITPDGPDAPPIDGEDEDHENDDDTENEQSGSSGTGAALALGKLVDEFQGSLKADMPKFGQQLSNIMKIILEMRLDMENDNGTSESQH